MNATAIAAAIEGDLLSDSESSKLSVESKLIVAAFSRGLQKVREDYNNLIAEKDSQIAAISEEVIKLRERIDRLEMSADDSEMLERKNCLVLSGTGLPSATTGEICKVISSELIKDKLNLIVPPEEITSAYRVGKKPINQQPDKRSIVMKLSRPDIKKDILYASREKQNGDIFFSQNLTPLRSTFMYVLRAAKRRFPAIVSGSSCVDGRVFVYVKPPRPDAHSARDTRHLIKSKRCLEEFCSRALNVSLDSFEPKWPN
ncbi:hypothetical protein SNEBB_000505 [Seison nebaliae]|nr:hypothetical protein SNEBB_000505 [Seison nebaliae]